MTTRSFDTTTHPVWIFRFTIEHESGSPVDRATAEALMENIVKWSETKGLQVGGGYRSPKPEELEPGPIFDAEDDQK